MISLCVRFLLSASLPHRFRVILVGKTWPSHPLPVAAVALAGADLGLRVLADVAAEGAADVVALLELPLVVAADEALVDAGIDQLAVVGFPRHGATSRVAGRSVKSTPPTGSDAIGAPEGGKR